MGTCFSKKEKKPKLVDRSVSCPLHLHLHGILIWSRIDGTEAFILPRTSYSSNVLMNSSDATLSPQRCDATLGPQRSDATLGPQGPDATFGPQTHDSTLGQQRRDATLGLQTRDATLTLGRQTRNGREGIVSLVIPLESKDKAEEEDVKYSEYAEMIRVNKPLIIQHLLIHDVLPYLWFLDNHNELYGELKHGSQRTAVLRLLEEIEKSEEPQKWQKFIDALKASGYSYIVDIIKGYIFINQRHQQEYLKRHTPEIGRMISPPELVPYLIANELLSDSDKDNILCECKNNGNYAGAVLLLDRITRKHGNWYMLFIKALEEATYHEVAENLRKVALMEIKKVMDHREPDVFDNTNECKYENKEIEEIHKEYGLSPVPTGPCTKKGPVPTPRKSCMDITLISVPETFI